MALIVRRAVAIAASLFAIGCFGTAPAPKVAYKLPSLDAFPRDLAGITAEEVGAELASCRASAVISLLSPGR